MMHISSELKTLAGATIPILCLFHQLMISPLPEATNAFNFRTNSAS